MGPENSGCKTRHVYCRHPLTVDAMRQRPRTLWSRLWRLAGLGLLAWVALSWLVVFALRFIPPWTSAMMMERRVAALVEGEKNFHFHHRWVGWSQVTPLVPLAMVAGEDQKFPFQR